MIKPHITEKSLDLTKQHKFTFVLNGKINKPELAKYITAHFDVHPVSVRTITKAGRRFGIVRLKAGEKIEGFEIKSQQKEEKKEK